MPNRFARHALLLMLVNVVFLLASCRSQPPSLSGLWLDQSPAALLYEFRDDGSVWLLRDEQTLPVFRFEVEGDDLLRLYDGMGRKQEFRFTMTADRLVLESVSEPAVIFAEYLRQP